MIREKIISACEIIADKYNELIDQNPHNVYYDRPNTLDLLPDVSGKIILDAASGPGKYVEILIGKGAIVKGFDLSLRMVKPKPSIEIEKLDPKLFQELNEFPAFMCIRAVKRSG